MDTGPAAIGRYQIRARLGQGGMGVLYLALDPAIDRLIALKLLRVDDDDLRERFLREARLAARLQHPNIVTIYDVGAHEGQPFIAMEYIAGETLSELIQRRAPLPLHRKLELILDACQGLAYAHRNGIVHRDIKPANLMVNRDAGTLKVLDFGIARGTDSNLTQIGTLIGTPNYMAPEQVEGKPIDQRADIFALGLVLYELLVYRPAFKADTPHAVLHQVLHASPRALQELDPTLDPGLAPIIDKAIAKNPGARYADLDRLRADLIRVVQRLKTDRDAETMLVAEQAAETRITYPDEETKTFEARDPRDEVRTWTTKARTLLEAGSLTEASQAVLEALKIDRQHADALAIRTAIERASEVRERQRERTRAVTRALVQAEASIQTGALDTALRATTEALGYDPDDPDARAAHARVQALLVARQASADDRIDAPTQSLSGDEPPGRPAAAESPVAQDLPGSAQPGAPAQGLSGDEPLAGRPRTQSADARGLTGSAQPGAPAQDLFGDSGAGQRTPAASTTRGLRGAEVAGESAAGAPASTTAPAQASASASAAGTRGRSYLIAGVAALVLGVALGAWIWSRGAQTQDLPPGPTGAVTRQTAPAAGGAGNTGANAAADRPAGGASSGASANDKAANSPPATGTPGSGTPASGLPAPNTTPGGSPAGNPTGVAATPPPAATPGGPPSPPSSPAAGAGAGANVGAPSGENAPAAVAEAQVDSAVRQIQLLLTRRRRQEALDLLTASLRTFSQAPKLQALLSDVVRSAQHDAEQARTQAVSAQAPGKAGAEYQRAEIALSESRTLRQRGRQPEAIRAFWEAEQQFDAARAAAARATTTATGATTATGTPGTDTPPAVAPAPTGAAPPVAPPPETTKTEAPKPPAPTATDAPRPPPPTPPAARDQRAAIQQALDRWAAAYATLQTSQVAAVWPTITPAQAASLRRTFRDASEYSVTLSGCTISESGAQAKASCNVRRVIRYKDGRVNAVPTTRATFELQRQGTGWVIVGVKADD